MTNELLEQWRKEAEDRYPDLADRFDDEPVNEHEYYRTGYIEGCKATHEKMYSIVYEAYCSGIKFCNGEENYDWETFKTHFKL